MGEFSPPPPPFLSPLLSFFLIPQTPQPGFGSITLLQKFTPPFQNPGSASGPKVSDNFMFPCLSFIYCILILTGSQLVLSGNAGFLPMFSLVYLLVQGLYQVALVEYKLLKNKISNKC